MWRYSANLQALYETPEAFDAGGEPAGGTAGRAKAAAIDRRGSRRKDERY